MQPTLPDYWKCDAGAFDRVTITDSEQLSKFQQLLDDTWKAKSTRDRTTPLPKRLRVTKVQRVESVRPWAAFVKHRRQMQSLRSGRCTRIQDLDGKDLAREVRTEPVVRASPELFGQCSSEVNEHYLLHGTSPAGALGIIKEGFDLSRAGSRTGAMFGPGAYFAECSSKADEYAAQDDFSGMCAILCCRVCCGRLQRRLGRSCGEALAGFDGVLGDREASVGTYREFVVFSQQQIYPEYLILYERDF